jgi:hypothetical protein
MLPAHRGVAANRQPMHASRVLRIPACQAGRDRSVGRRDGRRVQVGKVRAQDLTQFCDVLVHHADGLLDRLLGYRQFSSSVSVIKVMLPLPVAVGLACCQIVNQTLTPRTPSASVWGRLARLGPKTAFVTVGGRGSCLRGQQISPLMASLPRCQIKVYVSR